MSEPAWQSETEPDSTPTGPMERVDPTGPESPPGPPQIAELRFDDQGRRLCHARRRGTTDLCRAPAMQGQNVCRNHGGANPQAKNRAKLRLLELVDPAIKTLAKEMRKADKSADRQAAANSILDRAGWGRVAKIETHDARDLLVARLRELRDEIIDAEVVDEPSDSDRRVETVRQALTQAQQDDQDWDNAAPESDTDGAELDTIEPEKANLPPSESDPLDPFDRS